MREAPDLAGPRTDAPSRAAPEWIGVDRVGGLDWLFPPLLAGVAWVCAAPTKRRRPAEPRRQTPEEIAHAALSACSTNNFRRTVGFKSSICD